MRYLTCAETARLIRPQLKRHFPGVKFRVRSKTYSMGASISVRWTDGPPENEVEKIVAPFAGADFDGMIDLKTYSTSYLLPDGSACFGNTDGTEGSRGTIPARHIERPPEAEEVHMGADFVFTNRDYSLDAFKKAVDYIRERYAIDPERLKLPTQDGRERPCFAEPHWNPPNIGESIQTLAWRYLRELNLMPEPIKSPDRFSVDEITLTENDKKDGFELRFPDKPNEPTRRLLKDNGWRWSRFNGCWYHRRTTAARQFAQSVIIDRAEQLSARP